ASDLEKVEKALSKRKRADEERHQRLAIANSLAAPRHDRLLRPEPFKRKRRWNQAEFFVGHGIVAKGIVRETRDSADAVGETVFPNLALDHPGGGTLDGRVCT